MKDEDGVGRRPEEDFEIVEIDTDAYLTAEQKSWPVGVGRRPEEAFAIEEPLPVLDVRVTGTAPAEQRLPALVSVFSDQEAALGGSGLDVSRQVTENGHTRATLVPRSAEGARERLTRVAQWATALGPDVAVTVV